MAARNKVSYTGDDQDISLVLKRAERDISVEEVFHYKVLNIIKLFYKLLIAGVIGFMCLHQTLDYIASRRHLKSR